MKPMLAQTFGPKYNTFPAFAQPKLNGVRALHQHGQWQSRGLGKDEGHLWKPSVLAHLTDALNEIKPFFPNPDALLDGELYLHGMRLQSINGAVGVNRNGPRDDTHTIQYHVFDCINSEFKEPFWARFSGLHKKLTEINHPLIRPVETVYVSSREHFLQFFNHWTAQGFEGGMLRLNEAYEPGLTPRGTEYRSKFLWKHKDWEDDEFLCVGRTRGEGKASIGIGALVLQAENGERFEVGTGFTDLDRVLLDCDSSTHDGVIGAQVKIRFIGRTARGVPFNPSFLAVLS